MNLLQYTSGEMFSSTDLIRKSKNIFNKLNDKDIEKAVILRDGKPSFILMDFNKYENLISDYMDLMHKYDELKNQSNSNKKEIQIEHNDIIEEDITIDEKEEVLNTSDKIETLEEINNKDLEDALAKIDELDFTSELKQKSEEDERKEQDLKEFWD